MPSDRSASRAVAGTGDGAAAARATGGGRMERRRQQDGKPLLPLILQHQQLRANAACGAVEPGDASVRYGFRARCAGCAERPSTTPASVLSVRDGKLHPIAAPSLPASYTNRLVGVSIGPMVGSSGAAAYYEIPGHRDRHRARRSMANATSGSLCRSVSRRAGRHRSWRQTKRGKA